MADPAATSVEITLGGGSPPARAAVGRNGFVIADLPEAAYWALLGTAP